MKPNHFLFRYIVEGVLIFGSVFGAFLLEDYRSESEQKQIFVKRWSSLINSTSNEVQKFTDLLDGSDENGFNHELGVYEWVNQDSALLDNYDHLIRKGEVRPIIETLQTFGYWAMSLTEEAPYYRDILENHPDLYLEVCLENPQVCEWLDLYFQYHRRIDRYNRYCRELYIKYWDNMNDQYPVPEIAAFSDSLAVARDFRSHNFLLRRYKHSNTFTRPTIESMIELNKKLTPALREVDLSK